MRRDRTERDLVDRVCAGDERALNTLYDHYCDRLYSFIYWRVAGDEATAEDLTQETFMAALRNMRRFAGSAGFFTWLCAIARHKVGDHFRRMHRLELAREALAARETLEAMTADSPEERLSVHQRRRAVVDVLRQLPARYQHALILKYVDGRPTREVAAALGTSEGAAESVLTRARAAFRRQFLAVAESGE